MKIAIAIETLRAFNENNVEICKIFDNDFEGSAFNERVDELIAIGKNYKHIAVEFDGSEVVFYISDKVILHYLPICLKVAKVLQPIIVLAHSLCDDLRSIADMLSERR
jgi:hypothetical protein